VRRSTNQWCKGVALSALAVLVCATGVRATEETASNIDLMQNLTAQVVQDLHAKFAPSLGLRAVQLKPAGSTEDYYFVTNVFRAELMKLGLKVIEPAVPLAAPVTPSPIVVPPAATTPATGTQPATQPNNLAWSGTHTQAAAPIDTSHVQSGHAAGNAGTAGAYVLQYQNVVFNVRYVDSHRSWVVGGKRVERNAAVRIMATLTDPADGRVVWVGEATRDSNDEIDYGKSGQIEQGNYAFNKPLVPSAGWGKYVEPVFVTGIIVGLIYLFFSNQSNN
jgi:hypothetical protein